MTENLRLACVVMAVILQALLFSEALRAGRKRDALWTLAVAGLAVGGYLLQP